ncbi:NHL domain-containing protein [Quillaja saponaria]|uniref:NHL domain-containing protein n=1 Tax=Quillaja saponaria TaxID=32244 RepID=A0AAD7KPK0_QUISA|nr:NHL domain-containing protein [Quillaja saponaria]
MASILFTVSFIVFINLASLHVSAELVLEDGYTVTTVIDGHKLRINPHSILPRSGSSEFIVLDLSTSTFYSLSFPIHQENSVKRLSGNGSGGFSDGELGSAQFNKPRSFAVDLKGNVYVADQKNRAIRKISWAGVTTIAGGYSQKPGHEDGPAQNASFSDDFELAFIPGKCALLVSDHGNQLVRQINLKEVDCSESRSSQSGAVGIWALGLGLSCLAGVVIGIAVRPYIISHEGSRTLHLSETWKHCLISLGKQVLILCSGIKSAVASGSSVYALLMRVLRLGLSHLLLMFRINNISSQTPHKEPVSLLDLDVCSSYEVIKPSKYADQLSDLITSGKDLSYVTDQTTTELYDSQERSSVFPDCHGVDHMIQGNIASFAEAAKDVSLDYGCLASNSGLVKRK